MRADEHTARAGREREHVSLVGAGEGDRAEQPFEIGEGEAEFQSLARRSGFILQMLAG